MTGMARAEWGLDCACSKELNERNMVMDLYYLYHHWFSKLDFFVRPNGQERGKGVIAERRNNRKG